MHRLAFPDTFRPMLDARPRLYFDFVDPGSYLMDLRLDRLAAGLDRTVERVPFELRPPPEPLLDAADPGFVAYWSDMARMLEAEGVRAVRPALVPWTRKAHELVLHAAEQGADPGAVRRALFRRFHEDGLDIGRVDVLLEVAAAADLDRTATKAVLDVDRHAGAVRQARAEGEAGGVRGVPTLTMDEDRLEGIHDEEAIRAFLGSGAPNTRG